MPVSVIVIGAGVIGSTIAWDLAAAGAEVRILDARRPGQGATRASAGVLAPYIEGDPESPLRELGRDSLDLYDGFVARLRADSGRDVVYERNGTLEVALTTEEAETLAAASGSLWRSGVEARWMPAAVIEDAEPQVTRAAMGALLVPAHGFVGVRSLATAAIAAAEARGAQVIVETGAVEVQALPGPRVVVRSASSSMEADAVVMAAGSWSSSINVVGADAVPVRPIRGQLLQLQSTPGLLRHVIWGTAGYLVPWPDGSVLAGATMEDVGFDERPTDEARRNLIAMAVALVPALRDAPVVDVRVGLRPRAPDDLPIIGRSQVVPGLVYATAHHRNGVLLAPLTAQLVHDAILGGSSRTIGAVEPSRCGNL